MSNRAIEYKLLQELLETYSMFYSHDYDITHTCQRLAARAVPPMPPPSPSPPDASAQDDVEGMDGGRSGAARRGLVEIDYSDRESRFVWNAQLLKPFLCMPGAVESCCLLPVMQGFVAVVQFGAADGGTGWMALIARRDRHRCGYRSSLCQDGSVFVKDGSVFGRAYCSRVLLARVARACCSLLLLTRSHCCFLSSFCALLFHIIRVWDVACACGVLLPHRPCTITQCLKERA